MKTDESFQVQLNHVAEITSQIIQEVEKAVVGKTDVLKRIMATLVVSGGHILLEDNPDLAKTLIANSFATAMGLEFKRVQFTPDLLPGDITGGYIFDSNQNKFLLRKGPIFTQVLLADEINRASPKTQSALLEAMQEYQVSLEGESLKLPNPFIVIATQNPIDSEGTFPLPEAQLDRFIMKLSIGYPTVDEEQEILNRRRERKQDLVAMNSITDPQAFLSLRKVIEDVYIHPDLERYIVNIVARTRNHRKVMVGVSPRGSIALLKLTRAWAAMNGRSFVIPDDIKQLAMPALCHRIILEPSLWGSKYAEKDVIEEVVSSVAIPVVDLEQNDEQ